MKSKSSINFPLFYDFDYSKIIGKIEVNKKINSYLQNYPNGFELYIETGKEQQIIRASIVPKFEKKEKIKKEKFYSSFQAAELLGLSASTIDKWTKKGKIKHVRTIGGHRRIPIDEITRIREMMEHLGMKTLKENRK